MSRLRRTFTYTETGQVAESTLGVKEKARALKTSVIRVKRVSVEGRGGWRLRVWHACEKRRETVMVSLGDGCFVGAEPGVRAVLAGCGCVVDVVTRPMIEQSKAMARMLGVKQAGLYTAGVSHLVRPEGEGYVAVRPWNETREVVKRGTAAPLEVRRWVSLEKEYQ